MTAPAAKQPFDQQNIEPTLSDSILVTLIAARSRIESPEKWCKGSYEIGEARCIWGATQEVCGTYWNPADEYLQPFALELGHAGSASLNDHPETTHADVLALFDRAIAARKAELLQTNKVGAVAVIRA